jgi:hypothetical protein
MKNKIQSIQEILQHFFSLEEIISVENLIKGNINDSYKINMIDKSYLLQRINTDVFSNPIQVIQNIEAVTTYIQRNFPEKKLIEIKYTKDENPYYLSSKHQYWRVINWIDNSVSYSSPRNQEQAEEAGKALADFHNNLVEYPVHLLFETIPNFHNTSQRYEQFLIALDNDIVKRKSNIKDEVDFLLERVELSMTLQALIVGKKIPIRVTHNDPKMDNILLDQNTGRAICLIDLDTIMPGTIVHDFGDMIRTCTVTASENETNLSKVEIDQNLFEGCVKGYASIASQFITDNEKENLYVGALTITYEQSMRFLTDYLNGDQYYKIAHPEHNLERAKNQIKLTKSIEDHHYKLQEILYKSFDL